MKSQDFIAPLHGLRGVAVLLVLVSHFGNSGLHFMPGVNLGGSGKVGVWLFFVLSAYLLTAQLTQLFKGPEKFISLYSYFVRRVFRIYPLFIVALVLHLIVRDITAIGLVEHLGLMAGHDELWAIPVEFKFYFCIPVIALLAATAGGGVALSATLSIMALCVWYTIAHPALVFSNELDLMARAVPLLLGSALALWRGSHPDVRLSRAAIVLAVPVFFALAYGFKLGAKGQLAAYWHPWLSVGMGVTVSVMVAAALQPGWFASLMANKALVYFGEISFSLYLLHMFVVRGFMRLPELPMLGWPTLAACVVVAYFSHRFVEKPGMEIGKRLSSIRASAARQAT